MRALWSEFWTFMLMLLRLWIAILIAAHTQAVALRTGNMAWRTEFAFGGFLEGNGTNSGLDYEKDC